MSGDKALGINLVYEHNTRRGIATAIPLRKNRGPQERGALDTERYDRHGIPRCRYCGGPGDVDSPGLGLYFDRDEPRLRYRCRLGHTPDCDRQQSIACRENWRLLVPLSRLTEQYHALSREGKHAGRVHHHARQRYGAAGKDYTGRVNGAT